MSEYATEQEHTQDIDDLFRSGAPGFKFATVGDMLAGTISQTQVQQERDYDTDEPLTWPNGNPRLVGVLTITSDEGEFRVWLKSNLHTAMKAAVKAAGQDGGPKVGATVVITFARLGVQKNPKFNAPKLFDVEYTPPTATAKPAAVKATAAVKKAAAPAAAAGEIDADELAGLFQ